MTSLDAAPRSPTTLGARALTIALAGAVVVLLLPYVAGLLGAMVLYVVSAPLMRRIDARRRRRVAAFATVFALFFALVLPAAWLLAELVGQLPDAVRSLEQSAAVQRLMAMQIGAASIGAYLRDASSSIVSWSSRQTITLLGGIRDATLNLIIALFGTYYLLISADALWERLKANLPFPANTSELLRRRFHRVTEAMLLGVVLTGLAQGTLVGVAFAAVGFEHGLFWGAVTAVVSILPIFGSALVWLPGTIVLLVQQRYGAALALGSLGLVVISNIDNALRLVVYRRVSHIHPMVTLVGAFAGGKALGLAGLLLGPLVLSYALELVKVYDRSAPAATDGVSATSKGFPVSGSTVPPTPAAVL